MYLVMGYLRKAGAGRLLRTVQGQQHATEDDHDSSDAVNAAPLPTPPDSARNSRSKRKSEARQSAVEVTTIDDDDDEPHPVKEQTVEDEDYNRDPVSSSDEADDMAGVKRSSTGNSKSFERRTPNIPDNESTSTGPIGFRKSKPIVLDEGTSGVKKTSLKMPSVTSASITASPKRILSDTELGGDSDEEIFGRAFSSSQPKNKRPRTSQNIHTVPRSSQAVFGKDHNAIRRQAKEEHARKKKSKEERNKFKDLRSNVNIKTLPAPAFKRHHLTSLQNAGATAGAAEDASRVDGSSSPLSSLSASPEPDSMSIVCETCHERVNKLLKEEYDDDYVKGKSWNIQWQERFCEWHRAQTAKETWQEKGYPELDWMALERRMRKHDHFLLSVLRKEVKSHYRDEYAAKVKAKSMSNGFKDAEIKPGATVGYYGPKGEKAMCVFLTSDDEIAMTDAYTGASISWVDSQTKYVSARKSTDLFLLPGTKGVSLVSCRVCWCLTWRS
jgi:hypothetical protein